MPRTYDDGRFMSYDDEERIQLEQHEHGQGRTGSVSQRQARA
jgi:hypothetical protein